MMMKSILIAKILGAHGVHGSVRVQVYSDTPEQIGRYKKLMDKHGNLYTIKKLRPQKDDYVIIKFDEASNRTAAEALRGVELYVTRDQLPDLEEEEYYISDLEGLSVRNLDGEVIGQVKVVENHGAGYFLSIDTFPKISLPFTKAAVPEVHVKDGYVVVDQVFLNEDEE